MPEALAFPYQRQIGAHRVHAERPVGPAMDAILARADARLATSPIAASGMGKRIFLTDGGWRWRVLVLRSAGAFAISRPLSEVIVVNRSDIAADRVINGAAVAGDRRLSGTLAHEMTHGLIRRHFGTLASIGFPAWKVEGYCDHVAGGGSLDDATAARLTAAGQAPPALRYYQGRKRVEQLLAGRGGSVDALFAGKDELAR